MMEYGDFEFDHPEVHPPIGEIDYLVRNLSTISAMVQQEDARLTITDEGLSHEAAARWQRAADALMGIAGVSTTLANNITTRLINRASEAGPQSFEPVPEKDLHKAISRLRAKDLYTSILPADQLFHPDQPSWLPPVDIVSDTKIALNGNEFLFKSGNVRLFAFNAFLALPRTSLSATDIRRCGFKESNYGSGTNSSHLSKNMKVLIDWLNKSAGEDVISRRSGGINMRYMVLNPPVRDLRVA